MRPGVVNEQSVAYVSFAFYGKGRRLVTPSSVRYRIDDITYGLPGSEVTEWTSITPSTSVEVTVTADENSLRNAANPNEFRQITVEATGVDGEPFRQTYTYSVVNLAGTT